MSPGHAVGLCVRSVKACPGTTLCSLGQQDSLGIGIKLDEIYHGMQLPNKTKMSVSGYANQCVENCIKDISLVGKKSGWILMVGGRGTGKPRLAENLSSDQAMEMIAKVIYYYRNNVKGKERIGSTTDRIAIDILKTAVCD